MSTNAELSAIFSEMADVLELTGANPFRINAHTKVARILKEMTNDITAIALADDAKKQLTAIDGIGDGSAAKIIEFVTTGTVKEHDQLLKQIPRGLLDVMQVPGLGPKTVRLLWENAGVVDMKSLKKALESGTLEQLPRMGAKTIQNIKDSLAFAERSAERTLIGQALPVAEQVIAQLVQTGVVSQIAYAGSLRRGCETIGDIDILAATDAPAALTKAFTHMEGVTKVLAAGESKASVRLEIGVQVDLRLVEAAVFGSALMYFTGSKAHNIALRERAIKMGFRLNEYGLFKDDGDEKTPPQQRGVKPVAAANEQSIYKKLKLPFIPPELREDRGEFDADIPSLIELDDIKAELHSHTVASDGRMTIEQLAAEARHRGFHTIAITDHSKSSIQANGLSIERLLAHIESIREAARRIKGISLLAGSEVDILADGHLDYPDEILEQLDLVVASPHTALKQDPKKATQRLIRALSHPRVHILGHPTGRMINSREGLNPDINAIVQAAVEHNTALEINANYLRLDLRDTHIKAAVDGGSLVAINTDAHKTAHFDFLRYGILTARRGWLTADRCINTWPKQKLHAWLKKKR